ncbi:MULTISPECIES: ArdC family protein [Sphingomonas]|uniref:ArdC family protein n=1 Tax=Sphingomonas sediminicola TaxID=386874 RepID=UPI000DEFC47D|nr:MULTISPECIES: zincin-like metallopeptidase domain-containing protein [Sphingomonas]
MRANELFEQITQHIIAAVEAGASAFKMPWHSWGRGIAQPANSMSGRAYRGINTLLLWAAAEAGGYPTGRWATYQQWRQAGGQVRKGEKSTAVVLWKATGTPAGTEDGDSSDQGRRVLARTFLVFNEAQVEGVPPAPEVRTLSTRERITDAEDFVAATGAQIRHGQDQACFIPEIDQIWLPQFAQFRGPEAYYATVCHELVHWSGAKHRLARELSGRFATEAYAMEELVAELGSAFIAGHLGLTVEPRPDHAGYIASWLRVLKNDSRAIVTAAAKAQEAADYLIRFSAEATARPETFPAPEPARTGSRRSGCAGHSPAH